MKDVLEGNTIVFCEVKSMPTLYRIAFCSISKVAPVKCEQELMICCGTEIVPKRCQCEPHPSHN